MSERHIVSQGECLSKIALRFGFKDYKIIYNHPENAAFRARRPNPNIIFPGDIIFIPDKVIKLESAPTGRRHTYIISRLKKILKVRLLDSEGKPVANEPVRVDIDGMRSVSMSTDGKGVFELPVETACAGAKVMLKGRELRLEFSHLNPIKDTPDGGVSGIQARLRNLGYYGGAISDEFDKPTRLALAIFQHDAGLEMDGEPNPPTIQKLIEAFGC
jgi:hypothetical protein